MSKLYVANTTKQEFLFTYMLPENIRPFSHTIRAGSQVEIVGSEMDIDAILQRRPQLVLVDELAHTNAEGARHRKRFQDILELLESGIDVHTTVNIQHFESRADAVRR